MSKEPPADYQEGRGFGGSNQSEQRNIEPLRLTHESIVAEILADSARIVAASHPLVAPLARAIGAVPIPSSPTSARRALADALRLYAESKLAEALDALSGLNLETLFLELPLAERATIFKTKGMIHQKQDSHLRAVHQFMKALQMFEQLEDKGSQCLLLGLIADSLHILKNHDRAVEFYNKQIILGGILNKPSSCISAMLSLGTSYMIQNKYKLAITVFEQCLQAYCNSSKLEHSHKHRSVAKTCLANLGICYHQSGDFEQAIDAFETCIRALHPSTADLVEKATIHVHMACTLLMQQNYAEAVAVGIEAIVDFATYRRVATSISDEILIEIEQLESRAYTWVQLGELKRGRHLESLAVLEAINSKDLIGIVAGTFNMKEYLTFVSRKVLAVMTMMNRPIFVFQAICLQGFPNHLLKYCIVPMKDEKFTVRVNCTCLDTHGISDIRQWIFMCRHKIGMDVMSAALFRKISTLPGRNGLRHSHNVPISEDGDEAREKQKTPVDVAYSCVADSVCGSSEINGEHFYQSVPNIRPAFFDPDNASEIPTDPFTVARMAEDNEIFRNVYFASPFSDFDIDASSTFDSCFVHESYQGIIKNYQDVLKSAGTRGTFRIGTKCFEACREMYHLLMESFDAELSCLEIGSEIIIMPLGPLAMVPFPCLQNADEKYMIDSFRLRNLTSLMLTWYLNTTTKKDLWERLPDCMLVPLLDHLPAQTVLPMVPGPSTLSLWENICLVGKSKFTKYKTIPGADQEVFSIEHLLINFGIIAKSFGVNGPTRQELCDALTESSLVHIASHGTSHFIVIKGSDTNVADYEFCANDLFRLKESKGSLSPVLVVLNTCSGTPFGDIPAVHSNFTNLARAFHASGIRCVVSSSTRVEDSVAEDIMTSFYNGLLGSNPTGRTFDVVEAMQAAMIHQSMMHPTDPGCWAGYTVSGFIQDITK